MTDIYLTNNLYKIFEKTQISNLIKVRQEGAELFHEDGQTDVTKLTVALSNFANEPKMTYTND